mmetsp:Transcript_66114/g.158165  ORF Transcript_66114/g.158165 Transcript_66114/m.158165 type:complete len:632 (+) Transcript_66114:103-1998(+)
MSGAGLGYEILGAVKVKDGLFIGDEVAAQDLEFVVANKVTRVINCSGNQVPNHWEPIGVVYLTYYFADVETQIILDQRDVVANEIFRFIEDALEGAESVLIHSVRGQSRSCCVLAAYMMKKYSWGLRKTMELLSSRRPDLNLKPTFLQQLSGYERRLMAQAKTPFSFDWNGADFARLECEELLLRNTYINSQMGPLADFHSGDGAGAGKPRRLHWADSNGNADVVIDKFAIEKPPTKRTPNGQPFLKSLLKVSKNPDGQAEVSRSTTASSENQEAAQTQQFQPQHGLPQRSAGLPQTQGGLPFGTGDGPLMSNGSYRQPEGPIPTAAWGTDPDLAPQLPIGTDLGMRGGYPLPATATSAGGGGYPSMNAGLPCAPSDMNHHHGMPGPNQSFGAYPEASLQPVLQATRATNSYARRDSGSELGSRPGSRDPSPKTSSSSRKESPLQHRGESPMRLVSRAGRGGPSTSFPSKTATSQQASIGNVAFCISGIRASGPSPGGSCGSSAGIPGRGMASFRSGGPVKAKADVFGESSSSLRRRASPAPRGPGGPQQSRPASPMGVARPASRPGSPQQRPPSPTTSTTKPPVSGPSYPLTHLEKSAHARSLSSHMRRAPSPTPAFNRNPSPSRPRWRM